MSKENIGFRLGAIELDVLTGGKKQQVALYVSTT